MRRVAVKIAYLGSEFSGSQYQPGLRTVVGDIIADLQRIGGGKDAEWFDIKMAGRTDKGVNALDNLAAFNTEFEDDFDLLRALNSVSKGIYYKSIADVDEKFNPRHANERIYRYILPSEGIDFERARQCALLFIGEHDFIRFCKDDDKPTVVDLKSVTMESAGDTIVMTFRSQYFLWNMIRKIAAAVSAVGKGERTLEDVRLALDEKVPINFGIARPDALTLTDTVYNYIEFRTPPSKQYAERLNAERFACGLKDGFFGSL